MNYISRLKGNLSRILALDHGDKKIGVAISDPMKIIAKPLRIIINSSFNNVLKDINNLIIEYNIKEILVGLPITLKNKESIQTTKVIKFIKKLEENLTIPIYSYDERLTSQIAIKSLVLQGIKTGHNKHEVDKTAAAIFLQNYLDDPKK